MRYSVLDMKTGNQDKTSDIDGGFGARAELSGWSACPYARKNPHAVRSFWSVSCDGAEYERALESGWRRSGRVFYRNVCDGCDSCVPIRVDATRVAPTKAQRRAIRLNADLSVSVSAPAFEAEDYRLFTKYLRMRHGEDATGWDERTYVAAYIESPVDSAIVRYRDGAGTLVALGFVDVLPGGFSSVYFAFDPDEGRRSLGSYSVFAESALLRSVGKRWYYLGFLVPDCRKMAYKANFRPHELARDGTWQASAEES